MTWRSSSTDYVNAYTVSYSRVSGCTAVPSSDVTIATTITTITGLQENIGYRFRLTTTNSAGTSTPDAVYEYTMPSACKNERYAIMSVISRSIILVVPSEAPPQLMLQQLGTTTFTATWERESCLSRNGPNQHYSVRYYETGSTSIPQTTNVDINSRTFTANSLTPATSYTFKVAFTNSIGNGPFSTLTMSTLGYDCKSLLRYI